MTRWDRTEQNRQNRQNISGPWAGHFVAAKNLFELELSLLLKPKKYKHFSRGSKVGNTLLTRLRVGRSTLPSHLYSIGLIDSPQCQCGYKDCNTSHFILDCPLYIYDLFKDIFIGFSEKLFIICAKWRTPIGCNCYAADPVT